MYLGPIRSDDDVIYWEFVKIFSRWNADIQKDLFMNKLDKCLLNQEMIEMYKRVVKISVFIIY